jgi:hypothetical protein
MLTIQLWADETIYWNPLATRNIIDHWARTMAFHIPDPEYGAWPSL